MAVFPTAVATRTTLPRPLATDDASSSSWGTGGTAGNGPLHTFLAAVADELIAIETKLGKDSATDVNSVDYKLAHFAPTSLGLGGASPGTINGHILYSTDTHTDNTVNEVRHSHGFVTTRTFTANIAALADGPAVLNISSQPNVNAGVAVGQTAGMSISGVPNLVNGTTSIIHNFDALIFHWDAKGLTGVNTNLFDLVRGIYMHVGSVWCTVTDMVGMDIETAGYGIVTNAIGLRIGVGGVGTAMIGTNKWGFQVGNFQSQHMGKLGIGGATPQTVPAAQLHVTETSATLLRRYDAPASVAATGTREDFYTGEAHTTNATVTALALGIPLPNSTTLFIHFTLIARTVGGTDSASWVIKTLLRVSSGGTVTNISSVQDADATKSDAGAAAWVAAMSTGFGFCGLNVTGAAATTIDWHATARVMTMP